MDWSSIGVFVAAALSFAGLNLGALKWLLDRHDSAASKTEDQIAELIKGMYELRANLPLEYVRREDWLRFGATLDAKMDAMRAEMREWIAELKRTSNV